MFKKFIAWIKGLREDAAIAKYHNQTTEQELKKLDTLPLVPETMFDIYWCNEDGGELAKRIKVPREKVRVTLFEMLNTEVIETGDIIYFRWHRTE